MPDAPESYSYADDLACHRREKKRRKKMMDRLTGQNFEPRRYSAADESFARRLRRGVTLRTGGLHEIE